MALKFLNKKGWHTGSLRNIENVWKAEQKHEAEQKKLEELRKQIQDERERSEFRLLQEQAGLLPKQERLDFLYDSGLAVGKGSGSSGGGQGVAFKTLEEPLPNNNSSTADASSSAKQSAVPGALFEDKPHSANDTWRKLHSDPLLMIRQREQEALSRIKNNPVQMSLIRKSVETNKEKHHDGKDRRKKHKYHKHSLSKQQSDSENDGSEGRRRRKIGNHKSSKYDEHYYKAQVDTDEESSERETQRRKRSHGGSRHKERSPRSFSDPKSVKSDSHDARRNGHDKSKSEKHSLEGWKNHDGNRKEKDTRSSREGRSYDSPAVAIRHDSHNQRRNVAPKLSEEERAARLREMQADAELHEEQRWKRLRKAEEDDAREASRASALSGRNFLDAAHKSVYGAEKGGSSTIEESVRRRTHYLQGRSEVGNGNAFRR